MLTSEEVEKYWAMYIKKTWVVRLDSANRKKPKFDNVIVKSETEEGAIRTAKLNCFTITGKCFARARLADPEADLGCTRTSKFKWPPRVHTLTDAGIDYYYPRKLAG